MAAKGMQFHWRWFSGTISTNLDVIWGMSDETYQSYFPENRRPARTCIGVSGLALGALVEIDMVARRGE